MMVVPGGRQEHMMHGVEDREAAMPTADHQHGDHEMQRTDEAAAPGHQDESGASHRGHAGHQSQGGHDKHAGHHVEMFRRRFWWSLLLSLPVVVTSHMVMD